jgi:glucose/mannose-6-phosphate isomerase
MMKALIEGFPAQLRESIEIAKKAQIRKPGHPISNVVVAGMGGSGIGGSLIKALAANDLRLPLDVSKSYDIPGYINQNSLFIACSFSGNTEETLSAVEKANQRGAHIICITSGGKLLDFARQNNGDFILIPGHSNSPRASIGYGFVQLYFILHHLEVLPSNAFEDIEAASRLLESEAAGIRRTSLELTAFCKNKFLILYGDSSLEAVLVRTQQQIAENSKQLSHVNVFPEMNHNELVGWKFPEFLFQNAATILLRTSFDHPRTSARLDVCMDIFRKVAGEVKQIEAIGKTQLQQAMYLIHLLDWLSFDLAEANQVDPFPVEVINFLKNELAQIA